MKVFACFLIILANVSSSFQRLPMGGCDRDAFFLEYINPTIGWIGVGAVNLGNRDRLDNITITVKMETKKLENTSYLGEIKKLDFKQIQTSDSYPTYSIFFEIRLPIDNPLPNINLISVNEYPLCMNPVQFDDSPKIHLRYVYNYYLKTEVKFSDLIEQPIKELPEYKPITKSEVEDVVVSESEQMSEPLRFSIDCGKIAPIDNIFPRILDRKTIQRGAWPWLVSIYSYTGPILEFQCGGTLISNTLVITAAHCFFDEDRKIKTDDVIVIVGQYNLKRPFDTDSDIMYPSSVNIHPEYRKRNSIDSDIAVVVFKKSTQFTRFIRPACLWNKPVGKESIVGVNGVTAGWERDENGNFFTELLKKIEVPIVSHEMCLRSNNAFTEMTSNVTFCAELRNGTNSPCDGDSGGGLLFEREGRWTLRGVVSSSLDDCDQREYAVFTDIVPFIEWIKFFSDSPMAK